MLPGCGVVRRSVHQAAAAAAVAPAVSRDYLYPMTDLNAPSALKIVRGEGCYVTDSTGRTRLEGMAGLWCTSLGWGHPELIEAATRQMRELSYYHTYARSNEQVDRLCERLLGSVPASLSGGAVFFGSGGGDANEAQVRIAWLASAARGKPEKKLFVSRQRAYHGSSTAAGSLTGLPAVSGPNARTGLPLPQICAAHVRCPHFWRDGLPGESPEEFGARCASELDEKLAELNARDTVAAMIVEPVQGAGGVVVPPPGYFEAVSRVCAAHDVRIIADEVITGFGRTGSLWGCESTGLHSPHALSSAKQLTSAYVPFSATVVDKETASLLKENFFSLGYTYSGHPLGAAVANATLDIYERDGLYSVAHGPVGETFSRRIQQLRSHPLVGEVRHLGLVGAVELTNDPNGGKGPIPFTDPNAGKLGKLAGQACLDNDLHLRASVDTICICPPLVITPPQVDELFDKLHAALDDTLQQAGSLLV